MAPARFASLEPQRPRLWKLLRSRIPLEPRQPRHGALRKCLTDSTRNQQRPRNTRMPRKKYALPQPTVERFSQNSLGVCRTLALVSVNNPGASPEAFEKTTANLSASHPIQTQTRSTNQAEASFGVLDPKRIKHGLWGHSLNSK